jgi:hypothetical protein
MGGEQLETAEQRVSAEGHQGVRAEVVEVRLASRPGI